MPIDKIAQNSATDTMLDSAQKAQMIRNHLAIGRERLQRDDFAGAVEAYEEITKLDPQHVGALGDIVIALQRQGKTQAAIKAVRKVLAIAPGNVVLLTQLGHLLGQRTNWKDSEAAFLEALKIDPLSAGALGGLASTLHRQGKSGQALELIRKATAAWPSNSEMFVREGLLLEEHHRLAEAKIAFQKANELKPGNKLSLAGLRRVRDPVQIFKIIQHLLQSPDDAELAEHLAVELEISSEEVADLIGFALNPQAQAIPAIAKNPFDCGILDCILRAAERALFVQEHGQTASLNRIQFALATSDRLAEKASHDNWTPAQWISAYLLRQTSVIRRAAVVVTMRDEGLYILEWVAHYRALGFDTIFIYSNNNADKSDGLLHALASCGIITYIENQMDPDQSYHPQRKAYGHALHFLPELWEHEWVLFVDGDEFLIPDARYSSSVAALLDDAAKSNLARPPSAICFHWFVCFSDFIYEYQPGLLLERFQHGIGRRGIKSMVRLRDIYSMHLIHFPDMAHDGFLVTSDFKYLEKINRQKRLDPIFAGARLNHYWTKSFEEFSLKKARGDAASDRDQLWLRNFELFFLQNDENRPENYAPVPEHLIGAVKRELKHLITLPGIAEELAVINAELPKLLTRFDQAGGLPLIYREAKSETSKQRSNLTVP